MVSISRDYPGDAQRQRHLDFVNANWCLLAREAYKRFLADGHGILVVQESDFIGLPKGVLVCFQMGYITEISPGFEDVLGAKERGWVRNYDPASTLLVGFAREDGGFSSYRLNSATPSKTPKALYDGQ